MSQPRRVLFVWQPLEITGGVETFLSHCLRILPARYGWQPCVLQVGPSSARMLPEFSAYRQYLLTLAGDAHDFEPGRLVAEHDIGVVVFNDWVFSHLLAPLAAHAPVVMVCNSHQPHTNYYSLASKFSSHVRAFAGVSETITSTLRANLPPARGGSVRLVRNGVEIPVRWDHERWRRDGPLRLIYLGRLEQEYKRVLDLVDLAAELDRLNVAIELLIVGDGPDRDQLAARLAAQPLVHVAVRQLGHLPHAEALRQLATCDVLVLTSDTEGLPLCLLEGAARGVVPVVTRLPNGIERHFAPDESVFLFEPGDVAAAAHRIADLASDRSRLGRAARATRAVAEGFDLDASLAAFVGVLKAAAGVESSA